MLVKEFEKSRLPTSSQKATPSQEELAKMRRTAYADGLNAAVNGGNQEHCPYTGGLGAKYWAEGFRAGKEALGS
jgi:ribosome modulation factor